jgi:hypothetical protein
MSKQIAAWMSNSNHRSLEGLELELARKIKKASHLIVTLFLVIMSLQLRLYHLFFITVNKRHSIKIINTEN